MEETGDIPSGPLWRSIQPQKLRTFTGEESECEADDFVGEAERITVNYKMEQGAAVNICCWPIEWKHVDCSWVCASLFISFMYEKWSVFENHSTISAYQSLFPSQYHLGLLHNVYNWQQMNKLAASARTWKWEWHLCPMQADVCTQLKKQICESFKL